MGEQALLLIFTAIPLAICGVALVVSKRAWFKWTDAAEEKDQDLLNDVSKLLR